MLANTGNLLYDIIGVFGVLTFFVYDFSQKNKKKFLMSGISRLMYLKMHKKTPNKEYPYLNLEIFLIALLPIIFIDIFSKNLGLALNLGKESMLFFMSMPYLYFPVFWTIKLNPLKQMDIVALGYPLAYLVMKIACFFAGCCGSLKLADIFCMYNYRFGRYEFPLQIVEALFYGLAFLLLYFSKKKIKTGNLLPSYLILHGIIRFVTQILKNREAIIGPFTDYHFVAIILILSAIFQLIFNHLFREDINNYFDEINTKISELEKTKKVNNLSQEQSTQK